MADEKWLMITPNQVSVHAVQISRSVAMGLDVSGSEFGLAPGLRVALEMSPKEARQIAEAILRAADEVEDGLPRA